MLLASTSATRTSPSAWSGRRARGDAPCRDATAARPPTSSSCSSTASSRLDGASLADVTAIVARVRRAGRDRRGRDGGGAARIAAPRRDAGHRADRRPRRPPGARSARTDSSTRSPPPACTGRRRSSSTSARRPPSTASRRTARTSAGRSRPGLELGLEALAARTAKLPRDRAPRAGPGDRPRHGQRDPVGDGLRLPGARDRAARADPRGAGRDVATSRPADPRDPDRRPVRGAVGRAARRRRRHRPGPDAQGPRPSSTPRSPAASPALAHGRCRPDSPTRWRDVAGGSPAGSSASASRGSIAAYKAVELLRAPARRGRGRRRDADTGRDAVRRAAHVRGALPPRGRDGRPATCCPTGGSGTSSSPTPPTRSSWRRRPPAGWRRWRPASPSDAVTADLPRDGRAGRRRAGDGRRHVDRTRRPATTSRGCATLRLHDRGPRRSGRSRRASPGLGRLADARRRSSTRSVRGRRRHGRSAPPTPPPRPPTVAAVRDADLDGRRIVVVTAGGTAEPIDPVRFIGNRSHGQDGRRDRGGRPGARRPT